MVSEISKEIRQTKEIAKTDVARIIASRHGLNIDDIERVIGERMLPLSKISTLEDALTQAWVTEYRLELATQALDIQADFNRRQANIVKQELDDLRLKCAESETQDNFACWRKDYIIHKRSIELAAERQLRNEIRTLSTRMRKLEGIYFELAGTGELRCI